MASLSPARNKSSENQIGDYMGKDSAQAENPSPVSKPRLGFEKNLMQSKRSLSPGWKARLAFRTGFIFKETIIQAKMKFVM